MIIQACLDAITEHQRLKSLMKGELIKGLLPHGSVHADYTIRRIEGNPHTLILPLCNLCSIAG
jgi:hypothetical protein